MNTLQVFSAAEAQRAKVLLAGKVATMMGRKFEEGDWSEVYCRTKRIPDSGWSNLHIDVNHGGLGVEFKMLRVARLNGKPIQSVCGTTMMHPAATRLIRIEDIDANSNEIMEDVFKQYSSLIEDRTRLVREGDRLGRADMRMGWLLWEDDLKEFLYFEEPMMKPDSREYYAEWNETGPRGARKGSKSLWIFERETHKKRYSVTTSAGIKIQPYFDVPSPRDPNLVYIRTQSERRNGNTVVLWVTAVTAEQLRRRLGSLRKDVVSRAVIEAIRIGARDGDGLISDDQSAVPVEVSDEAFEMLEKNVEAVSDEHRVQLLLKALG